MRKASKTVHDAGFMGMIELDYICKQQLGGGNFGDYNWIFREFPNCGLLNDFGISIGQYFVE